jgi:hypothetical protein
MLKTRLSISDVKQLPIENIQRIIKYPYKRVYVSLDTKNANDIFNRKIYQWNIEEGLRSNFGSASVIGELAQIVAVKLYPIVMQHNSSPQYSNNQEMLTLNIKEFPNNYVGLLGNRYHFKLYKNANNNGTFHYDLIPTQDYYWMLNHYTQLNTITLELNQIQNLPNAISTVNIIPCDLLTTNISINSLFVNFLGQIQLLIFDVNTLIIGDIIIISGYDNGTPQENEIVNNPLGYPILNIQYGFLYTLDFIPGFFPFQSYLTGIIPSTKTVINLEFLTM